MPPRKRARVSEAASPTNTSQPKTPTPGASSPSKEDAHQILNDPWTDDEEIGLFKGLMKYKPTGIHKHFHLLALHNFLLANGYIHPRNEHTRPPGMWKKLQTLYDLDALDEREDARQLSDLSNEDEANEENQDDDVYSEAENKIHREDFGLPDGEYAELKWRQRFLNDGEKREDSPPLLPELNFASAPPVRFTPSFSVEPGEAATTPASRGRGQRGGTTRRGRGRARIRASSTRQSAKQAEEKQQEQGAESVDEEQEETEDDEEREESEESGTPARSTRAAERARGRNSARNTATRPRMRGRRR